MSGKQRTLLAASVAGLLAALGLAGGAPTTQAAEGDVHCYGVNKCKGTGDCGGKGTSCAGTNACKGQGFLDMAEDDCMRIDGGRLTPEPEQ
jgi:uncharacterized membrane protein